MICTLDALLRAADDRGPASQRPPRAEPSPVARPRRRARRLRTIAMPCVAGLLVLVVAVTKPAAT